MFSEEQQRQNSGFSLDSKIKQSRPNRLCTRLSMSAPETTTIHVTLPDGSAREVPKGTTALDIARSISPRLADAALVAKIKLSALATSDD